MKLIICRKCSDVVLLRKNKKRTCDCGLSWGEYTDNLNARIGGNAIPLGFANSSLVSAIRNRPKEGLGSRFEAFVIPEKCPTIVVEENLP